MLQDCRAFLVQLPDPTSHVPSFYLDHFDLEVGIQNVRNFKSQSVMTMNTLKLIAEKKTSQVDLER
jgi:hypothetical protein